MGKCPWFMRLTLVNMQTGQSTFAMYPCDKYIMLESLDCCQLPYGSGEYAHLAVSTNGIPACSLQKALTRAIESKEHPPSMQELNYLGEQIQKMSEEKRMELERTITEIPAATITDAINAAHRLSAEPAIYDGISMSNRLVLLGDDDPYILIQFVLADDQIYDSEDDGIWVGCPASMEDLDAAAELLGVNSYQDLYPNMMDGLLATSDVFLNERFDPVNFDDINNLAHAMKKCGVRQIGKLKAVLQYEGCMDFREAAELAARLDEYEFYLTGEFYDRYPPTAPDDQDELMRRLGFEDTSYGFIRPANQSQLGSQLHL